MVNKDTAGFTHTPSDPKVDLEVQWMAVGKEWIWLTSILPCEMAQNGDSFRGLSLAPKGKQWLMTVRLTLDDTPSVAFTCCGTPTACVASFKKRWDAETLQFFPDRYV